MEKQDLIHLITHHCCEIKRLQNVNDDDAHQAIAFLDNEVCKFTVALDALDALV